MNTPPSTSAPAVRLMTSFGLEPDPWQVDVLVGGHPRLLLNCCRQAGKSTVVAVLALAEALFVPGSKVLLLSRSHRQSQELFRIVRGFYHQLNRPLLERQTNEELLLSNRSRIVSLPCREETVRGYSHVTLLIIDEAARVPDSLYRSVRPMLAVSAGRLICLSTPFGCRGFFHAAWTRGGDDWTRIEVPATQVPRISPAFLEQERRCLGESWFRQEYTCSFEAVEGLVFPDLPTCVVPPPAPTGTPVGGIDFGFRNPFAAVWGVLDADDVLWLTGEHYTRAKPLDYHVRFLPADVLWYADPAGAQERCELLRAGLQIRPGINPLRLGIMAVTARIENNTLRIVEGTCPNLLYESRLYRYSDEGGDEKPIDEHNHALAALRYLIATRDRSKLARRTSPAHTNQTPTEQITPEQARLQQARLQQSLWNDGDHWIRL